MSVYKELIQTTTLSSSAAIVEFTIPQTYKDLLITVSARLDTAGTYAQSMPFGVNGFAQGSVWGQTWVNGLGSGTAGSGRYSSSSNLYPFYLPAATATAGIFGNGEIYICDYASTVLHKQVICSGITETAATTARAEFGAMSFSSTAAIESVRLIGNPNFVAGSTFSVYGIKGTV
jgi:hypothetical protein